MVGYLHRDVCMYMLYHRGISLFKKNAPVYQIITGYRPLPSPSTEIEGILVIARELIGNNLLIMSTVPEMTKVDRNRKCTNMGTPPSIMQTHSVHRTLFWCLPITFVL